MSLARRRVPFIPQHEMTECGAACLAMILTSYGRHVSVAELREEQLVSRDGASVLDLVRAAKQHGLVAKALKAETVEALADDYDLSRDEIEQAVLYSRAA